MLRSTIRATVLVYVFAICVSQSFAQEAPVARPSEEHQFLKRFVGEWITASQSVMRPDEPVMKFTGTIKSRMLGNFWVLNENKGAMEGTTITAMQTIGYDEQQKRYIGTWVDSMINYMWKYEGTVEGNKLTLEAEGPDYMGGGKMTKFRDSYEFVSDSEIRILSEAMANGKWVTFMTGTATRK